jgi:hypothetical protein
MANMKETTAVLKQRMGDDLTGSFLTFYHTVPVFHKRTLDIAVGRQINRRVAIKEIVRFERESSALAWHNLRAKGKEEEVRT